MIRHLYNLRSDPPNKSTTPLKPYSYYNILDYIPYAVLYIPVTIFLTANSYFSVPSHFYPLKWEKELIDISPKKKTNVQQAH